MGEAKRRKAQLEDKYGNPDKERLWAAFPLTQGRAKQVYDWTTRGAWIGIGAMAAYWVIVRFIGPAFGWWELSPLE
jgi:hypothetical protein